MERKKKICIQCGREKYIWSYGRCKECSLKVNALINRVKKKEKKESIPTLVKKLDEVFSIFIRQQGAINGINQCFTCRRFFPIKDLQCGHYYSRSIKALRWDEKNCHPQCVQCNIYKNGNYIIYTERMQETYTQDELEDLKLRSKNTCKMDRFELNLLIDHYSEIVTKIF